MDVRLGSGWRPARLLGLVGWGCERRWPVRRRPRGALRWQRGDRGRPGLPVLRRRLHPARHAPPDLHRRPAGRSLRPLQQRRRRQRRWPRRRARARLQVHRRAEPRGGRVAPPGQPLGHGVGRRLVEAGRPLRGPLRGGGRQRRGRQRRRLRRRAPRLVRPEQQLRCRVPVPRLGHRAGLHDRLVLRVPQRRPVRRVPGRRGGRERRRLRRRARGSRRLRGPAAGRRGGLPLPGQRRRPRRDPGLGLRVRPDRSPAGRPRRRRRRRERRRLQRRPGRRLLLGRGRGRRGHRLRVPRLAGRAVSDPGLDGGAGPAHGPALPPGLRAGAGGRGRRERRRVRRHRRWGARPDRRHLDRGPSLSLPGQRLRARSRAAVAGRLDLGGLGRAALRLGRRHRRRRLRRRLRVGLGLGRHPGRRGPHLRVPGLRGGSGGH